MYFLLVIAFLTGIFVKYADFLEDSFKNSNKFLRIFIGIIYGSLIFLAIHYFGFIAPLWIGIIIGVILMGKIDGLAHYFGLGTFALLLFSFGIPKLDFVLLLIFTICSCLDEFLSDLADKRKMPFFFTYRPVLEVSSFVYSAMSGSWFVWLALLCHDLGYTLLGLIKK